MGFGVLEGAVEASSKGAPQALSTRSPGSGCGLQGFPVGSLVVPFWDYHIGFYILNHKKELLRSQGVVFWGLAGVCGIVAVNTNRNFK